MSATDLKIQSEIGRLRSVILHRPSTELERITPQDLDHVLFEDIPWLKKMQQEHDGFAAAMQKEGCEIVYVETLLSEVFSQSQPAKELLVSGILEKELKYDIQTHDLIREFLLQLPNDQLMKYLIGGLSKEDIDIHDHSLIRFMPEDYKFYFSPLPNLYFMRDPAAVIGNSLSISVMQTEIRRRESMIMSMIFRYHPRFENVSVLDSENRHRMSLEGGDILVLSPQVVCIGCSQRTGAYAIEMLAKELLWGDFGIETVLAVHLPHIRSFMHLDTVLTMIDRDKFIVYPGILDQLQAVSITKHSNEQVTYHPEENLERAMKNALNLDEILFVKSGGNNPITAAREQWNDSSNTLAVAPGRVIAYDRNEVTNRILRENGVDVIEIQGSELVRGRGGPRCMSMPLLRERI